MHIQSLGFFRKKVREVQKDPNSSFLLASLLGFHLVLLC